MSVMEFVGKFGARVSTGELLLSQIEQTYARAHQLFIQHEYEEILPVLDDPVEGFRDLSGELVEMKNRALLWIYVIEWLAVSGTAAMASVVLRTLMIGRCLDSQAPLTRARS